MNDEKGTESSLPKGSVQEDRIAELSRKGLVRRSLLFLGIVLIGVLLDLGSKSWIFSALGMPGEYKYRDDPELHATWWIAEDLFGFQTSLNQGALFGIGQGKVGLFAAFSCVAITGILGWLIFFRGLSSRFLTITLGMITAGILGNLYDRLGLHGLKWNYADSFHSPPLHQIGDPVYAVRDWILVMIGSYHWPNFNIADSLLVCGAILIGIFAFFVDEDALFGAAPEKKKSKTT